MNYVKLGKTGLDISRVCLGCLSYGQDTSGRWPWTLPEEEGREFIKIALEKGINFFDTGNMYSSGESERVLGKALRDFANRDEIVVATKVHSRTRPGPNGAGLSRKAILCEIDLSLKRLGMDYVDLYIIHRCDPDTPWEETLETLNDVVRSGKARYIGASSMYAWQFMKALSIQRANRWAEFISMQNFYNLIYREEEREMLPLCQAEGIGVTPWSPLGRGKLTRPWSDEPQTERDRTDPLYKVIFSGKEHMDKPVVDRLTEIAKKRDVPPAQVALAWQFQNPVITAPIIGATKFHHIEDAIASLSLRLSEEEVHSMEELYQPHKVFMLK